MTKSLYLIVCSTQGTNDPMASESEHGKPTDGMMCLCTMEDITEEDKNYGKPNKW
jgi:hypothetical protein